MFIGQTSTFDDPNSKEGDAWGKSRNDVIRHCVHPIKKVIPIIKKTLKHEKRNMRFDPLYVLQLSILKMLLLCK